MIAKYKRGWYNDSYRHSLAAKGIKSKHDWRFHSKKRPMYVVFDPETEEHEEFIDRYDAGVFAATTGGDVETKFYAKKSTPDLRMSFGQDAQPDDQLNIKVDVVDEPMTSLGRLEREDRLAEGKDPDFYNVVIDTPGKGPDRTINVPEDQFAAIGSGVRRAGIATKEKLSEIPFPKADDWRQFGTDFREGFQQREEEFVAGMKGLGAGAKKFGKRAKTAAERAAHSQAAEKAKSGLKRGSRVVYDTAGNVIGYTEFAITNPKLARETAKKSAQEFGLRHAPDGVRRQVELDRAIAKRDQLAQEERIRQWARNI